MKITVFDPAMCCNTGVCGPEVDDVLVQTAALVKWLKSLGHEVNRHNISNDAAAFKQYPAAIEKLQNDGVDSLPYIFINDELVMSGVYPVKSEWKKFLLMETPDSKTEPSPVEKEVVQRAEILIAIGASVAANNEMALRQFVSTAKEFGLGIQEISQAMNIGNEVKMSHSQEVAKSANTLLSEMQPASNSCAPGSGCC